MSANPYYAPPRRSKWQFLMQAITSAMEGYVQATAIVDAKRRQEEEKKYLRQMERLKMEMEQDRIKVSREGQAAQKQQWETGRQDALAEKTLEEELETAGVYSPETTATLAQAGVAPRQQPTRLEAVDDLAQGRTMQPTSPQQPPFEGLTDPQSERVRRTVSTRAQTNLGIAEPLLRQSESERKYLEKQRVEQSLAPIRQAVQARQFDVAEAMADSGLSSGNLTPAEAERAKEEVRVGRLSDERVLAEQRLQALVDAVVKSGPPQNSDEALQFIVQVRSGLDGFEALSKELGVPASKTARSYAKTLREAEADAEARLDGGSESIARAMAEIRRAGASRQEPRQKIVAELTALALAADQMVDYQGKVVRLQDTASWEMQFEIAAQLMDDYAIQRREAAIPLTLQDFQEEFGRTHPSASPEDVEKRVSDAFQLYLAQAGMDFRSPEDMQALRMAAAQWWIDQGVVSASRQKGFMESVATGAAGAVGYQEGLQEERGHQRGVEERELFNAAAVNFKQAQDAYEAAVTSNDPAQLAKAKQELDAASRAMTQVNPIAAEEMAGKVARNRRTRVLTEQTQTAMRKQELARVRGFTLAVLGPIRSSKLLAPYIGASKDIKGNIIGLTLLEAPLGKDGPLLWERKELTEQVWRQLALPSSGDIPAASLGDYKILIGPNATADDVRKEAEKRGITIDWSETELPEEEEDAESEGEGMSALPDLGKLRPEMARQMSRILGKLSQYDRILNRSSGYGGDYNA